MTEPGGGEDAHYWAGGHRVRLAATDEVCLDLDADALRGLSRGRRERLHDHGRALTGALVLVPRTEAADALGDALGSAAGVHPVYRAEDALVVVLPEVRVEGEDDARLAVLADALPGAHVTEHGEGRVVVVPDSGRGQDALDLANRLATSADAELAHARFLRIVDRPRPGPT